jgi:putative restriction endonuclease
MNDFELTVGKGYTKEELEDIFGTNFGARIKGITLRRDTEGNPFAIVFSRAAGPYSDRMEGSSFFYDGEGTNKDQQLTAANKALVEANETGRTVYGFRQEEAGGLWHYLGILQVLEYTYSRKNGYMTYEFHFTTEPVSPVELEKARDDISKASLLEPVLTEATRKVTTTQTARDAAFSRAVKKAYNKTCAVCHKKRVSVAGYPEVEAAHIYPKEKSGADDYRNGIALCRLHHWAFDAGHLALSDDLSVITNKSILDNEDYEDIYRYAGKPISLPVAPEQAPHLLYIRAHRELHGL